MEKGKKCPHTSNVILSKIINCNIFFMRNKVLRNAITFTESYNMSHSLFFQKSESSDKFTAHVQIIDAFHFQNTFVLSMLFFSSFPKVIDL